MPCFVFFECLENEPRGEATGDAGLNHLRRSQMAGQTPHGAHQFWLTIIPNPEAGRTNPHPLRCKGLDHLRPESPEFRGLPAGPWSAQHLMKSAVPVGINYIGTTWSTTTPEVRKFGVEPYPRFHGLCDEGCCYSWRLSDVAKN